MENCEFEAEITMTEFVKEQVLHWPMPQGNVSLGSEQFAVTSCVPKCPGYFCYAEKGLMSYRRKLKMFREKWKR